MHKTRVMLGASPPGGSDLLRIPAARSGDLGARHGEGHLG
jgi:hypothetical protein